MSNEQSKQTLELFHAYRDLVKHEDLLRNERIKELFTIQGVLLGALGFLWSKSSSLLLELVCALGGFTTIYYYLDLRNGEAAMREIIDEWKIHRSSAIPRVIGKERGFHFSSEVIVITLLALWLFVFLWVIFNGVPKP